MRRTWMLLVMLMLGLIGCRGESPSTTEEPAPPPAPLERDTSLNITSLHLPLGAVEPRPVVVVFTENSQACSDWLERPELASLFVLCSGANGALAEKELKSGLSQLKKAYPRHLTAKSVSAVVAKTEIEHELDMILGEPSVFSKVLLVTEATRRLNVVFFTTFGQRGGKKFLVVSKSPLLGPIMNTSARAVGVSARTFAGGVGDVPVALQELVR